MVVLAIELYQVRFKVVTDPGEDTSQIDEYLFGEYFTPVLRNEDQMYMHPKYAMSTVTNTVVIYHRPSIQ